MGYFTLPSKSRRLAAAAGRISQGEPGQGEAWANSQGEEEVYRTVTRIRPVQVEVDMQSTLL